MNFVDATVVGQNGTSRLQSEGFDIELRLASAESLPERVVLGIRPEDLSGPTAEQQNTLHVQVTVTEQLGHSLLVYGECGGQQVVASLDPHSRVDVGSSIFLTLNLDTLHLFDPESEATLI